MKVSNKKRCLFLKAIYSVAIVRASGKQLPCQGGIHAVLCGAHCGHQGISQVPSGRTWVFAGPDKRIASFRQRALQGGHREGSCFQRRRRSPRTFPRTCDSFPYYRFLCFLLGPGVLRGGLGVGTWDVRLEEGASTSQDGEAYHYARSAILEAQKRRRFDLVLRSEGLPDEVLTTLWITR